MNRSSSRATHPAACAAGSPRPGFGAVFRSGEFRTLWVAALFSVVGDQLARVALATLVYDQTTSALWAATTYALTYLPAVLGGVLFGQLADRYPRRAVMVVSDLVRAALFALMAIPDVPLWLLSVLLVLAVLASPVHQAAVGALLPQILEGELYERGLAVRSITDQFGQLVGFAAAGSVLVFVSPSVALLLDAGTFIGSAILILLGVRARPAAAPAAPRSGERGSSEFRQLRRILADPPRQVLLAYAWMIGFFVIPEGLAVVVAAELGAGPVGVAALMAALPAGSILGAWAGAHLVPEHARGRLTGWLAGAAGVPLLLAAWTSSLPVSVALWALSGACSMAYLLQAQAIFMRRTLEGERGRAIGLANAGMIASQGVGLVVAGVIADQIGPVWTIAGAGGLAIACAAFIAAISVRRLHRSPVHLRSTAPLSGAESRRPAADTPQD